MTAPTIEYVLSPTILAEMRRWLNDCPAFDKPAGIDMIATGDVIAAIARHYDAGVDAFIADGWQPDTIPPAQGYPELRWRVYTVNELTFDALPHQSAGGPPLIPVDDWRIRRDIATDGQVTLHVYRCVGNDTYTHPVLSGLRYSSVLAADLAAYNARVIGWFMLDANAPRYGLPAPTVI